METLSRKTTFSSSPTINEMRMHKTKRNTNTQHALPTMALVCDREPVFSNGSDKMKNVYPWKISAFRL